MVVDNFLQRSFEDFFRMKQRDQFEGGRSLICAV
jgi:hypothetical protein